MIAPGTVLQNRYAVERQIGEGGMGAVYVATDRRFGSTVAIKETFFDDPALRKAFEREARLLNHLRHPALPRVSDHFEEGAGQFLVMEYIPGEDLSDMLKERGSAFPVGDVLAWGDQLLDALDYMHTQQPSVIHRDIKPQNLKLGPRNQVVLLDFGLAKGTPLQTRVTATGSVFGYSFNYAPIEQMQGTGTDPRSDLYSLGATLYHLLTAKTPPDALTRATAVLNGEPDPLRPANEVNPDVSAELARVLTHSLAMSASQRFASAQEMREALREAGGLTAQHREATTPHPLPLRTNLASEQSGILESETRVLGQPVTNRIPLAEAEAMLDETAIAGRRDAATFAETEIVKATPPTSAEESSPTVQAQAAGESHAPAEAQTRTATPQDKLAATREDKSVATKEAKSVATRVAAASAATPSRGISRRTLGLAAGAVVVALVAAGVYSFTRGGASPQPAPTQSTPQPVATQQLVPSTQPTAPGTEAQSSEPKTQPAQPHHTPTATANKDTKPENEPAPTPTPEVSKRATPTPAPAQSDDDPDAFLRNRDHPPSDEEIQQWMAQHPRRARMMRQLMMQERRRRNRQNPP